MPGTVALQLDFRFGSNGTPTTLVDNSAKTRTCDFPREQDMVDVSPFNGGAARQFAVGLSQATFDAEMWWDSTLDAQLNGLVGYTTAIDFQYGPDGSTTGNPKYTGTMFVQNVGASRTVGEAKVANVTFQITGAITRGVY